MITLEKMLFLKSIPLFKYTKDDVLLSLASVISEKIIEKGQIITNKGDFGDIMYLIVIGKVLLYDENLIIAELGERDIFGELAALVPDKRIASTKAIEETFLLTLDHSLLYNLMEMNIGLVKGIMQNLCSRIRETHSILYNAVLQ